LQDLLNDFQDASSNGDEWISFKEFCQAVSSLFEASPQLQQQQQQLQQQQQQPNDELSLPNHRAFSNGN
jgi:hypothetical protein